MKIIIPDKYKKTTPSRKKIDANINYYRENSEFAEAIFINNKGELIDGYTRYLAALELDLDPMDFAEIQEINHDNEFFWFYSPDSEDGVVFKGMVNASSLPLEIPSEGGLKGAGKANRYSRTGDKVYLIENKTYFRQETYRLWDYYLLNDNDVFNFIAEKKIPSDGHFFEIEFKPSSNFEDKGFQFFKDGTYITEDVLGDIIKGVYYRERELVLLYSDYRISCAVIRDNKLCTVGLLYGSLLPRIKMLYNAFEEQDNYRKFMLEKEECSLSKKRIRESIRDKSIVLTEEESAELSRLQDEQEYENRKFKEEIQVTRIRNICEGYEGERLLRIFNSLSIIFPSLSKAGDLSEFIKKIFPEFVEVPCVIRQCSSMYDDTFISHEKYGVYVLGNSFLEASLPEGINLMFIGTFKKREWVIESIKILDNPKLTMYDTETIIESRGNGKMRYNIFCDNYFPIWDLMEERNIEIDTGSWGYDVVEAKPAIPFPKNISLYDDMNADLCSCSGKIWEKTIGIDKINISEENVPINIPSARRCICCGKIFIHKNDYFLNKQLYDEEESFVTNIKINKFDGGRETLTDYQNFDILEKYGDKLDVIQKQLYLGIHRYDLRTLEEKAVRGYISDFIPEYTLQKNILLMAYKAEVVNDLCVGQGVLTASRLVKRLVENYGLSYDNSEWAIKTWIIILDLWVQDGFKEYLGISDNQHLENELKTNDNQIVISVDKIPDSIITYTETPIETCGCCNVRLDKIKYKIKNKEKGGLMGRKCPKCNNMYFRAGLFAKYPESFNVIGYVNLSEIAIIM